MADYPALPLWTDAYLGDTMHLSLEEHGAYLKLLMIAWRSPDCAIPDDDKRISTMLGITTKRWRYSLRPVLAPFWTIKNGKFWTQKKLNKVRQDVEKMSQRQRDKANARWAGKSLKNNATDNAGASAGHIPNTMPGDMPEPCPADATKTNEGKEGVQSTSPAGESRPSRVGASPAERVSPAHAREADPDSIGPMPACLEPDMAESVAGADGDAALLGRATPPQGKVESAGKASSEGNDAGTQTALDRALGEMDDDNGLDGRAVAQKAINKLSKSMRVPTAEDQLDDRGRAESRIHARALQRLSRDDYTEWCAWALNNPSEYEQLVQDEIGKSP